MGQVFVPPSSVHNLITLFSWFSPEACFKAMDFGGPDFVLVRFKAVSAFDHFSN